MTQPQRVPILVYHHVYPDDHPAIASSRGKIGSGVASASQFRRHLQLLSRGGWRVVPHSALVDWMVDAAPLPARSAVIHFDNGWLDVWEIARPLLDRFGATGTCYVISDVAEASSSSAQGELQQWRIKTTTEGSVGAADHQAMTWDPLRQLAQAGWEIGAHTATHPKMTEKMAAEGEAGVLREIRECNELIEKRLGFTPRHFAYPSGAWSEEVEEILAPHYRSARLWHAEFPHRWTFTSRTTSPHRIECQNIDLGVSDEAFEQLLELAGNG